MPFRLVALNETLFGLRELVLRRRAAAAAFFDAQYPGVFSGYAALAAYQCWVAGDLVLWAAADGGGLEQVAWRPGRFIEWSDTIVDVTITEYRRADLLSLNKEPFLHRRGGIATSAAGAERLQAFVRAEIPERMPDALLKEWILAQGARSEEALTKLAKQLGDWEPSRSQLRQVHADAKKENEALRPKRGPWLKQ